MTTFGENSSLTSNETTGENTAAQTDPLLGLTLNGKYRVIQQVARGGMSCIYTAEQIPLGRTVAIKVLLPDLANRQDPQDTKTSSSLSEFSIRFVREASMLSKLQHPNIITVFDYGTVDQPADSDSPPQYFMAMEFLQGVTLTSHLQRHGRLPYQEATNILKQVVQGLRVAHKAGIVHRDLKPSNIMLLPNGDAEDIVKILDFGILKILHHNKQQEQELTREGVFIGSPKYMAPEQGLGSNVDERSDIYSLGVIAYHMITGVVPFAGDTSLQTMVAHVNNKARAFCDVDPNIDCPVWIESLIMRCLAKNPDNRPQSCDELARELRTCGGTVSTSDNDPSGRRPIVNQEDVATITASELSGSLRQIVSQGTLDGGVATSSPGSRRGVSMAVVGGLLLAGVLGAYVLKGRSVPQPAVASATPSVDLSSGTSASAPSEPPSYRLVLSSTPPGARVYDGDAVLGITPTEITIDNRSLRSAPRPLLLRLDGYETFRIDPSVSNENVEKQVLLIPSAKAGTQPPAGQGKGRPASTDQGKGFDTPPPPKPARTLDDNPWEKKK